MERPEGTVNVPCCRVCRHGDCTVLTACITSEVLWHVQRVQLTCHKGEEGGGEPCACRVGSRAGGNESFEMGGSFNDGRQQRSFAIWLPRRYQQRIATWHLGSILDKGMG
jgi:hypothetical protein